MPYQSLTLKGTSLSALYQAPEDSKPLLVLAHGAGAGFDHHHMTAIADSLAVYGIGTLRFNFPFIQQDRRRVDSKEDCLNTIGAALSTAETFAAVSDIYLAGHSFGGRMASHYLAEHDHKVKGLVLFSFPLHVNKKPDIKRAAHLNEVTTPMLFLSGDRDTLAQSELLDGIVTDLSHATLHWLDTADHSYKILKRTRQSAEDVYAEAARVAVNWMADC